MHIVRLAVVMSVVAGLCSAKHFEVLKEGSEDPCVLLDVEFNIEVKAMEEGNVVATKYLTSEDRNLKAMGKCSEAKNDIALFFTEKSLWSIDFRQDGEHPVAIYRVFQFIPSEIFGDVVNETGQVNFEDKRTWYLKDEGHSYLCEVQDKVDYITRLPVQKYNYSVNVIISRIQTQGMGLEGRKYGKAELCLAEVQTTTPTIHPVTHATKVHPVTHVTKVHPVTHVTKVPPVTHVTKVPPVTHVTKVPPVTHVPPTQVPTPGPKAPVNKYAAKKGKVVCVAMDTSLRIEIKYHTTTAAKYNTVTVNVPQDARSQGRCNAPGETQALAVTFFNNWVLTFTFAKDPEPKKTRLQSIFGDKPSEPSYRISYMTLHVVVDDRILPNSKILPGGNFTVVPDAKTPAFPKKSAKTAYYQCNSKTDIVLKKGWVTVKTSHLKFKAFNTDETTTFEGHADVCASDNHSRSKAGLIAGVLISVIVAVAVAVLIVVLVARRKRKSYEGIQ